MLPEPDEYHRSWSAGYRAGEESRSKKRSWGLAGMAVMCFGLGLLVGLGVEED